MNGTGNEVVGLLAEAKRLAPDDPKRCLLVCEHIGRRRVWQGGE